MRRQIYGVTLEVETFVLDLETLAEYKNKKKKIRSLNQYRRPIKHNVLCGERGRRNSKVQQQRGKGRPEGSVQEETKKKCV